MHTEHLQRIRPSVVMVAWFVAVALASLIVLGVTGLGLLGPDSTLAMRLQMAAVAVGFFAGGLYAGLRAAEAPILHGVAIGIVSLVVWIALNVITALAFPDVGWDALTPNLALTLVFIMIVMAVLGARSGYRLVLKGRS